MSHITRKPVFGISDQVRLKPACSATETSLGLNILHIETTDIILSKQRITKAQMCRLICGFVVYIWHKQVLSRGGSYHAVMILTKPLRSTKVIAFELVWLLVVFAFIFMTSIKHTFVEHQIMETNQSLTRPARQLSWKSIHFGNRRLPVQAPTGTYQSLKMVLAAPCLALRLKG